MTDVVASETQSNQQVVSPAGVTPSQGGTPSRTTQMKRDASRQGDFADQEAALAPVQRHGGEQGAEGVHAAAAHGISGGAGAMPFGAQIQQSFGGYDVSHVQAHTDSAAAQANSAMGADAYATGSHIAFNGAPDLHTAAHEAAHVVQQQAGVQLSGGVGQVGDPYEQHADRVADAVVAGQNAEPILAEMAGGGSSSGVQQKAVQRHTPPTTTTTTPASTTTPTTTTTPAADPDVDRATVADELAAAASGAIGTFTPTEAAALAAEIAPSGSVKRSVLDTRKSGCAPALVQAWKNAEAANPGGFCRSYATPDVIATRKFSEFDSEPGTNYESGDANAPRTTFYSALANTLATGTVARARVFEKCGGVVRSAGLRMLGKHITQAQLQPTLQRTAGIGGTWSYTTDQAMVAADLANDTAVLPPSLHGKRGDELLALDPDLVKEYWMSKSDKKYLKGDLTPPSGGTWFSSGQITLKPGSGDTQFAQLMEIGALQPEWFADGACRFTMDSATIGSVAGNCVKPTCLDGMQSALFVPNPSPGAFGVTGGGVNEFLAAKVPASAVTSMQIISTSPGLQAAIERADRLAKSKGHGSAMDQMERAGAEGGRRVVMGESRGVYDRVSERTAQERATPTPVDPRTGQSV
jgi:hypothetical protein